jgi:DNA-binding FrmR family transcriptional regulator
MNPLVAGVLLPPRLALRTLDDLHTLATTAERAITLLERLDTRAARIEGQIDSMLDLGQTLEARASDIAAMGKQFDRLGDALMSEARSTQAVGREIALRGAEIAAALPLLQRALDLGEPLEGAIERAGRIVDRLPGGRGRAHGSGTDSPQKGA